MFYIRKNTVNGFVIHTNTLRDYTDSYFLWIITNVYTKEVIYRIWTDLSIRPCAYSLFEIVEDSTGTNNPGVDTPVKLIPGEYTYTVLETTVLSTDPSLATDNIIDIGILMVELTDTDYTHNNDNIYR